MRKSLRHQRGRLSRAFRTDDSEVLVESERQCVVVQFDGDDRAVAVERRVCEPVDVPDWDTADIAAVVVVEGDDRRVVERDDRREALELPAAAFALEDRPWPEVAVRQPSGGGE